MLLKLHLKTGMPVLVSTNTITEIRGYQYDDRLVTSIVYLNETATEVTETVEEVYEQWLSTMEKLK